MTKEKNEKKINNKTSIFEKFLWFIRENYKTLIFFIIFILIINYPLPYYVFVSGGITDLSDRFEVEDGYKQEGSYNLSYVNEIKGNVLTYLLSYIVPDWEREKVESYQISEKEDIEQIAIRDQLSLTNANQTAVLLAYSRAGKEIVENGKKIYVYALFDVLDSDKEIKIGDILLEADDTTIEDVNTLREVILKKAGNDTVKLKFKRGEQTYTTNVKVNEENNARVIGLSFVTIYDLDVTPNITFKFAPSESGSSAGLMTTLAIYDSLIEEDLTNGLKIAGTGGINLDGSLEQIGGVKYKLTGAESDDADIFFVPSGENYEEAIKIKKDRGYDIEIVKIDSFDDAINYLKNYKK